MLRGSACVSGTGLLSPRRCARFAAPPMDRGQQSLHADAARRARAAFAGVRLFAGARQYDPQVRNPTLADELAERAERDAVIEKIKAQLPKEKDRNVAEDLQILIHAIDLEDREQDFDIRREVPFINASENVFRGCRTLLDDQVAAERRPAAVVRLQEICRHRAGIRADDGDLTASASKEQIAKPGMNYPSKGEIETELGRNSNYVDGNTRAVQKIPVDRLGRRLREAEDAAHRLRCMGPERLCCRRRARIFACRRRSTRSTSSKYGIDMPPAENRGDGARGLQGIPGRDGADRRAHRARAQAALERLPRRHRGAEEGADRRRRHPAVLRAATEGHRGHHRRARHRDAAGPARDHPARDARRRPRSSRRRT